ncbi:MAG: hypothetical protein WBL53_23785, partial [Pseudonocardiaceae bacterium]
VECLAGPDPTSGAGTADGPGPTPGCAGGPAWASAVGMAHPPPESPAGAATWHPPDLRAEPPDQPAEISSRRGAGIPATARR